MQTYHNSNMLLSFIELCSTIATTNFYSVLIVQDLDGQFAYSLCLKFKIFVSYHGYLANSKKIEV